MTASLSGAPVPLPTAYVDPTTYPQADRIPPTDTAEVDEWMNNIDWSTIPDIAPTYSRFCANTQNAGAIAAGGVDGNCWWTCGGCTRDIDITTCASAMEYGLGFDDGPGYYTPKLLTYLESESLLATFYLVGSRVLDHPATVQYEYMTGHHLSVHTWSHGGIDLLGLTSMTNRQIVAELGYTKKIIHQVTGVTPTTMRPPYGDIDDRVRAISLAMGLVPIIWTNKANPTPGAEPIQWDSGDWKVHGGEVLAKPNQDSFEAILAETNTDFTDHGVIALQHDIFVEAVDLAIGYTLPFLKANNFIMKPVLTCQGRPDQDAYVETNTNQDSPVNDDGDVATRSSNIGYAAVHHNAPSVAPSRTYDTTQATYTGTHTATGNSSSSDNGSASRYATTPLVYLGLFLLGSVVML